MYAYISFRFVTKFSNSRSVLPIHEFINKHMNAFDRFDSIL